MKLCCYKWLVSSDIYRYAANTSPSAFMKLYRHTPGFKYTFMMRTAHFLKSKGRLFLPIYVVARWILRHLEFKYGISIPYNAEIGYGLYIGHFGGIVVHHEAVIGNNVNLNHGVTIGATYGGKSPGVPVLGDRVYIAPGSKIIGGITVGSDVAIGANSVVTRSIPDNAVVVGIPARIISFNGSKNYVINVVSSGKPPECETDER